MVVTGLIFFALILALFYSLDLMYTEKKNGYFVKSISFFLVSTIPQIFAVYFTEQVTTKVLILGVFFPVLVSGIIMSLVGVYIFYCRFKKQYNPSIFVNECITFADLLKYGWDGFKEKIISGKNNNESILLENEKSILNVVQSMGDSICTFISDNYKLIDKQQDPESFSKFVVENFISNYMSHSEARCLLRKRTNDNMVCFYCTLKTKKPIADIDISKENLITNSAYNDQPLIYSRNKSKHQDTNGSIKNGMYNDYVSYCLAKDSNNKPLYSMSIDVKGKEAQKKLHALVDSAMFKIIFDPIVVAFDKQLKGGN